MEKQPKVLVHETPKIQDKVVSINHAIPIEPKGSRLGEKKLYRM